MKRYDFGDPSAPVVLLQAVDEHDLEEIETECRAIRELTGSPFCLTVLKVGDWNRDLSPWKAPAVFGTEGFGDGAPETLEKMLALAPNDGRTCLVGGYSLAGLFALWAVYQTDRFTGAAAASPSIWFPGFTEYMKKAPPKCDAVYLSLGDKEGKTRNQVMTTVADRIREGHAILTGQGIRSALEWNPGNHFRDAGLRTAKAFAWLINTTGSAGHKNANQTEVRISASSDAPSAAFQASVFLFR